MDIEQNNSIYVLNSIEKSRWGIMDNGTKPIETTKGFNNALKWASAEGKTTFKVESGKYLIAKGISETDEVARINMVANMEFILDDDVVIQKETNGWEIYSLLFLGDIENVKIEGGTYLGDKGTHDYSKRGAYTTGTHEWGNGINVKGASNVVIDNVKLKDFTGDSIEIGARTVTGYYITEKNLESGSFDEQGNPIKDVTKVRSNNKDVTTLKNPKHKGYELFMWLPNGLKSNKYDMFYYREDGSFIKADKQLKFFSGKQEIPIDAAYYHVVFDASTTKGIKVNPMIVDRSKNITVKNSDLGFSRRQGISVVGGEKINIENNKIHDVKGTAPQSGIDLEGGYFLNHNVNIKGNHFYNNSKYDLILFDGNTATVENNIIESQAIGLAVSKPFSIAKINNNVFKNAGITVLGTSVELFENEFDNAQYSLSGTDIYLHDSVITESSVGFTGIDIKVLNVKIINKGNVINSLYLGTNPLHLKNITIEGVSKSNSILGKGSIDNIYDNLKIAGFKGGTLPQGTYNNCSFKTDVLKACLTINQGGEYVFTNCNFSNISGNLLINSLYGEPSLKIENSNFEILQSNGGATSLNVQGAKKFILLNNNLQAGKLTNSSSIIKLGTSNQSPTKIFDVTIKGNTIRTNIVTIGIDTLNAGLNAPSYTIEDNKLYNAKLKLKANDRNVNNKELNE
jgi:hypothetical protein